MPAQKIRVNPVTVGPIVGATTDSMVRLWGRGEFKIKAEKPMRCFGAARLRRVSSQYGSPRFFKMNPNFDMTGVVIFDGLAPTTRYEYELGWFFSDRELKDPAGRATLDWSRASRASFTTAPADNLSPRSFVFGSCRYLLRLFGGQWFEDRGDKAFRSIIEQIDKKNVETHHLLMVGDQIYADDLNVIAPDRCLDEYNQRYRDVFSQEYIRNLMSRIPTYMTLDDHEIEDNWPSKASEKDWVTTYPAAIQAYQTYQMSHSPLFEVSQEKRISGVPDKFWYTYRDGCCDFFVMDTRTERSLSEIAEEREMISEEQLAALKNWLLDASGRIKFVVTSVPFFPDYKKPSEDKWGGFLRQRTDILDLIRKKVPRRVVFLSGDVHCSMSAELVCPEHEDFKVLSVVSSSFFWPYPHPSTKKFALSGQLASTGSVRYQLKNAGPIYSTDNFTRVTTDLQALKVEVFARKGKLLGAKHHDY